MAGLLINNRNKRVCGIHRSHHVAQIPLLLALSYIYRSINSLIYLRYVFVDWSWIEGPCSGRVRILI
jgi:hypothetical protein